MEKVKVTSSALEDIFQMQKNLMEHYIRIEGLPSYPLNLNEKPHQKILKEFKERIIEELSEAYEQLLMIWVYENDNTNYEKQLALLMFNEEIADSLHFFVETLIFSGIDVGDINNFLKGLVNDTPGTEHLHNAESVWLTLFSIAKTQNMAQGLSFNQLDHRMNFKVVDQLIVDTEKPEMSGGRVIGQQMMVTHSEFLWELVFMLNKSTAFLKNKSWAQSEREANSLAYKQTLLETFLHFFRYMDFMGQNSIGLYHAYYRKNQILKNRIKNGY